MKNTNFFSKSKFETLIETNSSYLFDCLLMYGLDKNILKNKYITELIFCDFKKHYSIFCKYPKDTKGNDIPFNIYDMEELFKSFVDINGNYSRILDDEKLTLEMLDENSYKVIKNKKEKEDVIEIQKEYIDDIEMNRIIIVKRKSETIYKEISSRTDDIVTFNNIIKYNDKIETNKILIFPEKIYTLDSGIILNGSSSNYKENNDFRAYSDMEKNAIIDAMKKIYNITKLDKNKKENQKILL